MKTFCLKSIILISMFATVPCSAQVKVYTNDFSDGQEPLTTVGRGVCKIEDGVLKSEGNYATFGLPEWENYVMSFRARAPKDAEQVQIWAGFRAHNRFDRYVLGIKGGLQDDIYLMRLGYMGTDAFMGVRPLGFHPVPGEWYNIKIEVCGGRIRVFLNDENIPRLDVTDKDSGLAPRGKVTLGGGWIDTEFDDLVVSPLDKDALKDVKIAEYRKSISPEDKEKMRKEARANYQSIKVNGVGDGRTEVSLDGNWLFMPDYQLGDKDAAVSVSTNDNDWHVMSVPNFWNPIRIWLHGETMPSPTGPQPKGVSDSYYQQETARCEGYTFDYRKTKSAWYRQWIELPAGVENKNMTLTFDAVSKIAEVYINGILAGSHIGMYGEMRIDGSKLLREGNNLVVVKVIGRTDDTDSETLDFFYSSVRESETGDGKIAAKSNLLKDVAHGFYGDDPAGIWQPVKLTITSKVKNEDVFIKPTLHGATFDLTIKNYGDRTEKLNVYTDIIDKETGAVLYSKESLAKQSLKAGEERVFTYTIDGLKPRLWTPNHPNLYDFKFRIVSNNDVEEDCLSVVSGFRTFEIKDGLFFLNGNKYWLRGGNHIPFALAPNDLNLANTFMQLMKAGNIDVTRTHTTPWNELWMAAADRNGIGVSFEGTWPWLMIHSTPLPDVKLIDMWKSEFLTLLKKYRNHPSLLFWTVNNEMKFYDNDNDIERAKEKYRVISDVVKQMRVIDPTRPICFDSNYQSKGKAEKFGQAFMDSIDEGDIDDMHGYYNWYDYSVFRFFNGEFQQTYKMPARPLISQEMSTGYPNNETGHPTRSYQLIHQNPESLIGYESYDFANPQSFLKTQAFITGELAEALRRSNDKASGIMHFALLTWFRQVYDYQNIEPYPTYYSLKRALQPVLVSAELWGRNLYAGELLPTRIYVVNDREDGSELQPTLLRWEIQDEAGARLAHGIDSISVVKHYERKYIEPTIRLPELPTDKMNVKLKLKLTENGLPVSENEYSLLLARKEWNVGKVANKNIVLLDKTNETQATFRLFKIDYQAVNSIKDAINGKLKADLLVIANLNDCTEDEQKLLRTYQQKGGRLLFLNSKEVAKNVYPEYITGWVLPTEGDIVNMERPENAVFDDLDVLDLRYFNNNKREIPTACNATLHINRSENVKELAGQMKIHAYIDEGTADDRLRKINEMRGFTLLKISDGKGLATISTMNTNKATTDPVAGKLLVNMVNDGLNNE